MVFSSSKIGQVAQILASGAVGEIGINSFTPPTSGEIEMFVHVLVQVVVGLVTIYATVRKLFQSPETVVKLPVAAVVPPASSAPAPVLVSATTDTTAADAAPLAQ